MKKLIKKYGSAGMLVAHLTLLFLAGCCMYIMAKTDNWFAIILCAMGIVSGVFIGCFLDHCMDSVVREEYSEREE